MYAPMSRRARSFGGAPLASIRRSFWRRSDGVSAFAGLISSRPPPMSRNRRVSPVSRFIESVQAFGRVIERDEEPVRCTRRVNPGRPGSLVGSFRARGITTASSRGH